MSDRLQVSVLGPVRAWSDGRPLRLGAARQRTVFAVLVAAANRIVTAHELTTAVWGTSPPAAARSNLYTYIAQLRRKLPTGILESRPTGYLLRLDESARDSDRFVTMVAEAVKLQKAGDDVGAAARLGDALKTWHGEAYTGLEGEPFEARRAYLTRLRLDMIERRARILIERGDDDLVAELSGLVRDCPLHEPLYELLMQALLRGGRPVEALEVFRAARGVLVAELGVEPGTRLRQLHSEILGRSPDGRFPTWAALDDGTKELLRVAVLLGPQFRADALITVTERPPLDVLADVEEALTAEVLHQVNGELAFRQPPLAEMVLASIPASDRVHKHRKIAEAMERCGASAVEVAAQLTAEMPVTDSWTLSWAVEHLDEVNDQAPQLAARLSRSLLETSLPTDRQRERLLVVFVRSDFRTGGRPDSEARQALTLALDPALTAEMRQILATLEDRRGDRTQATVLLERGLADQRTPPIWLTRHRVLLARLGRAGDPDDAVAVLHARWLANSVRRDHNAALRCADRGLGLLASRTPRPDLQLDLLDNRIFSLQNLDRLDEAEQSLHEATLVGIRHRIAAPLPVTYVVQQFWTGRWTDAVAQISTVTDDAPGVGMLGRREQRAGALLIHGVAALIAAHRDDAPQAAAHLRASASTAAERENSDWLLVARALIAEQQARLPEYLDILAPLLDPGYAPMLLRHQWLPDLLRSAQQAGRAETAERAAELCAGEAAKERTPARAGAALARCWALMSGDPEPALSAAEHYRSVGRVFERAAALEDAAVLLAARGYAADAAGPERQATTLYRRLGALWDLRRLRVRIATANRALPRT